MSPAAFTLKAQRAALASLGKPLTVRRKPNSVITGVIAHAEFAGLRGNLAVFRVILQTPTGTYHAPVHVTRLPR